MKTRFAITIIGPETRRAFEGEIETKGTPGPPCPLASLAAGVLHSIGDAESFPSSLTRLELVLEVLPMATDKVHDQV